MRLEMYHGPSLIAPGHDIRVIASCVVTPSGNRKTGDLSQVYILPADESPRHSEARVACCGSCPLKGPCYVNWGRGPHKVWSADRVQYDAKLHGPLFRLKPSRFGAGGDPAAAPARVWREIRKMAPSWRSYTQFWREGRFQHMRHWCMASCHTIEQAEQAQAKGWSPYVALEPGETMPGARMCPYETSDGLVQCRSCRLCDGRHGAVQITRHGSPASMNAWSTIEREAIK